MVKPSASLPAYGIRLGSAQARAMARTRAVNGNFKPNDDYEKMQFYYHPDHLGSSTRIGKLVFNHPFFIPGVLAIAIAVALGFVVAPLML